MDRNPLSKLAPKFYEVLIRITEVSSAVGLSASTIYRKVADGSFPAGIKLGPRCTRWRFSEVQGWISSQGVQQ